MPDVLRIPCVLRGSLVDARCTLHVWQERSSSGRVFTHCRIDEEPELEDGDYTLQFGSYSLKAKKFLGAWQLLCLPREIGDELFSNRFEVAS